jgi:hypothetical protein
MDGLELVVSRGHPHERVEIALIVEEALPVGEQVPEEGLTLGWRVDDLSGVRVGELRSWHAAYVQVHGLDRAANPYGGGRAERPLR